MQKSLLCLISLLYLSFAVSPIAAIDQSTVLTFPAKSIGRVDIIRIDKHSRKVEIIGRARASGIVQIPADCKVSVVLNFFGGQHVDLLSKLPISSIYGLDCNALDISDSNLSQVGNLKKLVELHVEKTNFSDDNARHLTGLIELRVLILNDTLLTPEGLKFVEHFNKLEVLKVASVDAGGLSKVSIKALSSLRVLDLCKTKLTNKDLKRLTILSHLEDINISKNDIDDTGIESILKFKDLTFLNLVDTRVTARGLCRLALLSKLRVIVLRKSQYAPNALLEAQKIMPHVKFRNDDRESRLNTELFAPLK